MKWSIVAVVILAAGIAHAERRENRLHDPYSHLDDRYIEWEKPPLYAYQFRPGTRRCDNALIDPVPTPLRDAAIDAQRSACLRRELTVHLPLSALIDTPGFHGEIDGALQLGGRMVVRDRFELSAGLRAARFQYVQNAVNKATEVQLGPLLLGAAYGVRRGVSAFALAGVIEVPSTRDNLDTTHLTGSLTAITTNRLTARTTLHGRLGFVGARAWSLGGTTGRLAFRAGADVVRRLGVRWSIDVGAEMQAGWYDGFDGTTIRLGAQRRFGSYVRGMIGVGLPVGGDERTNAIIVVGAAGDLPRLYW